VDLQMRNESASSNRGAVVSVRGSVVDVRFDRRLPPIFSVLRAGADREIVVEVEFLPFVPETKTEKWITVTLWAEKRDADRWEREGIPRWTESSNSIWPPRPSAITTTWKPPFART
jgi:hypothetical protein